MASPYTSQAISGYNANPPPDDGSTGADNEVDWAFVKEKIGDPIKTLSEAINTAVSSAFGKIIGGVGVTSTAVDYTVLSADQGKLVRATASGVTITTPDATNVGSPFVFALLNNSSGTITFDGNGSQTIDGSANVTVAAGAGMVVFTDGSNWFTTGQQGVPVGKQLMYADIINGTITESNATNAVTYSLKTLAGADPSSADPVLVCFRNSTLGTGNYVYRNVTTATTLTISSGSTLGAVSNVPFRVWLVLFDDGGTIRLGAINCVTATSSTSVTDIYHLGSIPRASSTAEGGAGAADSAGVFYTGTAVTNKAYVPLGFCSYESGLATAGSWNVSPDSIQLYGHGVPLPGQVIGAAVATTAAVATGTTVLPVDDTIPQNTEGDQYITKPITPSSKTHLLRISFQINLSHSGNATMGAAVFQDSTAAAIFAVTDGLAGQVNVSAHVGDWFTIIAGTTSSTTFKLRAGSTGAGTTTVNGTSAARLLGGTLVSYLRIEEIMS